MLSKNAVVGIHGGHAVVGSRGASGYMDEVKMDRLIKKACIKELKKRGYKTVDCSVKVAKSAWDCLLKIKKKSVKGRTTINFSIHLNAGGGNGVEIYIPHNATINDHSNADRLCRDLANHFGFANRGIKRKENLYVCNHLSHAYIIEIGFVDSIVDKEIYDYYGCNKIGKKLADLIIKYF